MSCGIFVRADDDEDELEPRPALPCNDDDDDDEAGNANENFVPTTAEEYLRMVDDNIYLAALILILSFSYRCNHTGCSEGNLQKKYVNPFVFRCVARPDRCLTLFVDRWKLRR